MPSNKQGKGCGDAVRYLLRSPSPHKFHDAYDDIDVFLDFERCLPKDSERPLFDRFESIVVSMLESIEDLSNYGVGVSADVRQALQNPEIELKVLERAKVVALRSKSYYDLSKTIEESIPELLNVLVGGPLSPAEQIDSAQALCKQFARLIDVMFQFDFVKMHTPTLQNDFSFYRRVISHSDLGMVLDNSAVSLEDANSISLFLANATPMLNILVNSTLKFVEAHPELPVSSTAETLAAVVYICRNMLEKKEFNERLSEENRMFFLRVMVGSLVLFDHIDDEGVFTRQSSIDIRAIVEVIKQNRGEDEIYGLQMMNVLRYTTKHFKDGEIPKSIRALFN